MSDGMPVDRRARVMGTRLHAGLLVLGLALGTAAAEQTGGIRVGLERTGLDYRATERSSAGGVINEERGYLPGFAATVQGQHRGWLLQGRYGRSKNDVQYQGYTQIGIPLSTRTQLAVHQTELRASHPWPLVGELNGVGTLGIDHLRMDRNILPALGSLPLQEVLDSTRLLLGVGVQHALPSLPWGDGGMPGQFSAGVEILPAVRNRIAVNSLGLYDPITLAPARQTDWRWHAKAEWRLMSQVRLSLGVAQERFQPGGSAVDIWRQNGVAVAGVRYPGSVQSMRRWTLGLDWSF